MFITENLLRTIPEDVKLAARLSGYLTTVISVLIAPWLLYLSLYLVKQLGAHMNISLSNSSFHKASRSFVLTYIICEVTRFVIFYFFLYDSIEMNVGNIEFLNGNSVTNWEYAQDILIIIFVFGASGLFMIDLFDVENKQIKVYKKFLLISPTLLIPLITNYKASISVWNQIIAWI